MGRETGIEWTDSTWNPIRGCSRVSEACRHCYAEGVANRFSGEGQAFEGLVHIAQNDGRALGWNGAIKFVEERLLDPIRWTKPRRIFVNSVSDLFHENVTDAMRDRIFAVMALAPRHTFQVLTKRSERMKKYLSDMALSVALNGALAAGVFERIAYTCQTILPEGDRRLNTSITWPLPNVWLGVTVENQEAADERIPLLLRTPASVRFLSCEPLLGPVDLCNLPSLSGIGRYLDSLCSLTAGSDVLGRINWVIAGGESGRHARLMHPDWARGLRDQCAGQGVPFFFKQWGEWCPRGPEEWGYPSVDNVPRIRLTDAGANGSELGAKGENDVWMNRAGKKLAGSRLDGHEHKAFPEVAHASA